MIYLTKGQKLVDNPGMVVYNPTGYYNDGDSVICATVGAPDEPVCRYEAKFIAYGGLVYSISDPDELLEQVLKLDPKSLFGKDSKQVAVDKMVEKIVPQAEVAVPVKEVKVVEEATTTPAIVSQTPDTSVSTTTSTGVMSTTTPTFDLSTTTPNINIPAVDQPATTTPPDVLFPDANVSSTTPATTTPEVVVPDEVPAIEVPPIIETPTDTSTTSDEVVAFAKGLIKNKISQKLGL